MTAQGKADILRSKWDKAKFFADGELNTLGWKIGFPRGGSKDDYVQIVEGYWTSLKEKGWSDDECVILILGGTKAESLVRNS